VNVSFDSSDPVELQAARNAELKLIQPMSNPPSSASDLGAVGTCFGLRIHSRVLRGPEERQGAKQLRIERLIPSVGYQVAFQRSDRTSGKDKRMVSPSGATLNPCTGESPIAWANASAGA